MSLTIAIASDHAGYRYKEIIKDYLVSKGYTVMDFGTDSEEPVDYPKFIRPAAEAVGRGECDQGIVLGGSGNGEAIVANKVRGIRCALCWNEESARLAREHNDANVISLGQRMMSQDTAIKIVDTWLSAEFEGGRHEKRIEQIESDESSRV
jgi:ribose 5-phosphate isomerase B